MEHQKTLNLLKEVLKYNLCDYNNTSILVRGDIIFTAHNNVTPVAFKNCAPCTKCITKIDGTTRDDAKGLDLVMPMYNLIEYSSSCSDTTGSLWFHSYKNRENLENTVANGNNSVLQNATIAALLRYHLRSLEMLLINYRVELKLTWKKYFLLALVGVEDNNADSNNLTFDIKDTELYVLVISL